MMNKMMKKLAVVFTVAALAVAGGAVSANAYDGFEYTSQAGIEAQIAGYSPIWTCTVDVANIREGASTNSAIVGNMYYGDRIEASCYTEDGWIGIVGGGFVKGDLVTNGNIFVDEQTYAANIANVINGSSSSYDNQSSAYASVVYPRVDRHLSGAYTSWCSLNTDGFYYNERGERFADNGNGTFSDVYGNILNVIG